MPESEQTNVNICKVHEEHISELASYWFDGMDMKELKEYVIGTLKAHYVKNPADFKEQWKEYKEIMG